MIVVQQSLVNHLKSLCALQDSKQFSGHSGSNLLFDERCDVVHYSCRLCPIPFQSTEYNIVKFETVVNNEPFS
jgi:hypothetical protein